MAIGDVVENLSELISVLPPEIVSRASGLITILKAVGIFAIIYVIYVVTMGVLGLRSRNRMKAMEKKLGVIDKKLNKLLKVKKK